MKIASCKSLLSNCFKWALAASILALPVAPAWASPGNRATITSGGSQDPANPTPVYMGDLIQITGQCSKSSDKWDRAVRADYLIYSDRGSSQVLVDGAMKPDSWLYGSNAEVIVGETHYAQVVGWKFQVQLKCVGTKDDAYASRYYEVAPDQKPPSVTPFGSWMNAYTNQDGIDITAAVADAGSGIGKVWVKWTGAPVDNIEMQDSGQGYHQYHIDLSGAPEGGKDVQIWAETPAHANKGWQAAGNFILDRSPPTLSNGAVDDERHQAVVRIHAVDNLTDIKRVRVRWEARSGGMWWREASMAYDSATNDYLYTIDKDSLRSGNIPVQIQAFDMAGNETAWTAIGDMVVDHPLPTVAWDKDNAKFARESMQVRARVTAAQGFSVSGVSIWWQGAPGSGFPMTAQRDGSYTYTIPTTGMGEHSEQDVMFLAVDNTGMATSWMSPDGSSFTVDRTPPRIEIAVAPSGSELNEDLRFTLKIYDIASGLDTAHPPQICWMQKNPNGAWPGCTSPADLKSHGADYQFTIPIAALHDGELRVAFNAQDKLGNSHLLSDGSWPDGLHFTILKTLPANVLFENPQFTVVDDSPVDKDHSGDLSRGDDLIYALRLDTGKIAANGLSLRYALPPGLAVTPNTRPYFAPESTMTDGSILNAHWNGADDAQLLADSVDLAANSKLILHIPVTITAFPAASPIASTVLAGATNAKDDLRLEHNLSLQNTFPANQALNLELTSLQSDWKYRQGTAFDYRIALRVREWDLSNVELRYALPAGLERNGEARIEGVGAAAVRLNPAWGEGGEKLLLSSTPGVMLAARHAFNVIIPVKVGAKVAPGSALRSEIEASAGNLSGPVTAMHSIVSGGAAEPEEQLVLKKTIDRQAADNRTALPGQTLRYTITYSNVGIDDLHDLVIRDTFQSDYLTLGDAQCGPITPRSLQCRIVAGSAPGKLEWRLDGKLEAGDAGSVSYDVVVNRR